MIPFTCAQCAHAGTHTTFTTRFELAAHGLIHWVTVQEVTE